MPDWLFSAALSGVVTGLVAWGGIRVELRYMRRDIDQAVTRLRDVETRCLQRLCN